MSSDSSDDDEEIRYRPTVYYPTGPLKVLLLGAPYRKQPIRPRHCPIPLSLLKPIPPVKRVPIKNEEKGQCSNRLKVLEEQPEDVLRLEADLSESSKTKIKSGNKSVNTLLEQEKEKKKLERWKTTKYPPGSYEHSMQAILQLRKSVARNKLKDGPSTSKGKHDS